MTPTEIVLWSLLVLPSIGIICGMIVVGIVFSGPAKGKPKTFSYLFQRSDSLRILTVMSVVLTVAWLSILDVLKPGAIAILSGVTGYVLGGLGQGGSKDSKEDQASSDDGSKDSKEDQASSEKE